MKRYVPLLRIQHHVTERQFGVAVVTRRVDLMRHDPGDHAVANALLEAFGQFPVYRLTYSGDGGLPVLGQLSDVFVGRGSDSFHRNISHGWHGWTRQLT